MTPRAVVLDADGVIQTAAPGFRHALERLVTPDRSQSFLTDVFAAEAGPLIGDGDFAANLARVLERWRIEVPVEQVLDAWAMIEPLPGLDALVARLRARGIVCALGTNQHAVRARIMRETLGYGRLFDRCFFSCELGARKPQAAWFRAVLDALAPAAVLFVDDQPANVEAARAAGMQALVFRSADHAAPDAALATVLERALGTLAKPIIAPSL